MMFHRFMKTKYDPNTEFFTEKELTEALFSSLFINTVMHGVQNILTNGRGLDDEGMDAGQENQMFSQMGREELDIPDNMRPKEMSLEGDESGGLSDIFKEIDLDIGGKASSAEAPEGDIIGETLPSELKNFGRVKNYDPKTRTFQIDDWSGYPDQSKIPQGPLKMIDGDEDKQARRMADSTNKKLHKLNREYDGLEIHEIHPVKFGGSPDDIGNKLFLTRQEHRHECI